MVIICLICWSVRKNRSSSRTWPVICQHHAERSSVVRPRAADHQVLFPADGLHGPGDLRSGAGPHSIAGRRLAAAYLSGLSERQRRQLESGESVSICDPEGFLLAVLHIRRGAITFISAGSSLKYCLVAEGRAHQYPRLSPTMEWDTAAGQIIAECAGAGVLDYPTGKPLRYNKQSLVNPGL